MCEFVEQKCIQHGPPESSLTLSKELSQFRGHLRQLQTQNAKQCVCWINGLFNGKMDRDGNVTCVLAILQCTCISNNASPARINFSTVSRVSFVIWFMFLNHLVCVCTFLLYVLINITACLFILRTNTLFFNIYRRLKIYTHHMNTRKRMLCSMLVVLSLKV